MLVDRLQRWPSIKTTLGFASYVLCEVMCNELDQYHPHEPYLQSQKAVFAYFTSEQIAPFVSALRPV